MATNKSDALRIFQDVLDEPNQAFKMTMVGTQVAIAVSVVDNDSVIAHTGIEPRTLYDYVGYNYATTNTIIKTYKTGGLSGTTVGTVTEVYTDATLARLVSQTRT